MKPAVEAPLNRTARYTSYPPATKFTDAGYVLINVRLVTARDAGQVRLRFEVTDTGIGIPPDDCDRIFDRFTQADEAVNRRF